MSHIGKKTSFRGTNLLKWIALILLSAALVGLAIWIWPWLQKVSNLEDGEAVRTLQKIKGYADYVGIWKYPIAVFLQILQIVVAILPGGPMQIIMGFLFDTVGGLILSLLGIFLATLLIVWGVNKWGIRFAGLFVKAQNFDSLKFLQDPKKREMLLFVLFLVPGTPKDLLTFFAPLTGISTWRIVTILCLARVPSLLSSTYMGATLSSGNFHLSALVFVITAVLGIGGILFYDRFIAYKNSRKKQ